MAATLVWRSVELVASLRHRQSIRGMARWLVQLDGEPSDLEEFPFWFPDGEIHAVEETKNVYLTGPALEAFADADRVHESALQVLDECSAVISLLWPSFVRPRIARVIRETDDGTRQSTTFVAGSVTVRSKVRAALSTSSDEDGRRHATQTQAQLLLLASRSDEHLRAALSVWADPLRTWPRLFRILEEVEAHLGKQLQKVGICSNNQRERFTRSANAAEISGRDSRHALGKSNPPKSPMNLPEAVGFIGGVLQSVLLRAGPVPHDGPPT